MLTGLLKMIFLIRSAFYNLSCILNIVSHKPCYPMVYSKYKFEKNFSPCFDPSLFFEDFVSLQKIVTVESFYCLVTSTQFSFTPLGFFWLKQEVRAVPFEMNSELTARSWTIQSLYVIMSFSCIISSLSASLLSLSKNTRVDVLQGPFYLMQAS